MNKRTIKNLVNNNQLNIEEIIIAYSPYLFKIITNSISKKEDIEEILSDVFVALWHNQEKINNEAELKAYLVGITKNLIKKKYRNMGKDGIICDIDDYTKLK